MKLLPIAIVLAIFFIGRLITDSFISDHGWIFVSGWTFGLFALAVTEGMRKS